MIHKYSIWDTPILYSISLLKIIRKKLSIWENISTSGLTTVKNFISGVQFSVLINYLKYFNAGTHFCCVLQETRENLFFPDSCHIVKAQLKTFSSNTLSLSPPLSLCGVHSVTWQIPVLSLRLFTLVEIEISKPQSQQILILMCKQRHILFKSYL